MYSRHELYQRDESASMKKLQGSIFVIILGIIMVLLSTSCVSPQDGTRFVEVQIDVDQQITLLSLPKGSTVSDAIDTSGIELSLSDEINPPGYTLLIDDMNITITRVLERLEIVRVVLPFERQIVKNEAIPEGETRLLQPGRNGLEEITYQIIEEDGVERTRVIIKRVTIEDPTSEIMMVGAQQGYTPLTFSGKIVYVSAQNGWLIDGETGNRRPIVSSGDLDGRILDLSPDGRWLLFSRQFDDMQEGINSLWIVDVLDPQAEPIDLEVENIVHYAEWSPQSPSDQLTYTITYSTVEPRPSAPGWQANNDLQLIRITDAGTVYERQTIVETNSGGQYGWWGTTYSWSPNADLIAYSRADSIGLIDIENGTFEPLLEITPYQTRGDWAWVPPMTWGSDSETLYFITHGEPIGLERVEASPVFDLMALSDAKSTIGPLAHQSGMFSYLASSPERELLSGETAYSLAFLQATYPLESETSHYRLTLMDHDSSNRKIIFPAEGEMGMEPVKIVWAFDGTWIATIYQNNLWIIDPDSGLIQRITTDGQTNAFDWSR